MVEKAVESTDVHYWARLGKFIGVLYIYKDYNSCYITTPSRALYGVKTRNS